MTERSRSLFVKDCNEKPDRRERPIYKEVEYINFERIRQVILSFNKILNRTLNMNLTTYIHQQLKDISEKSIENTINCLNNDNTIPFIARYRKELTGNLDEVQISNIKKYKALFEEIEARKNFILTTLDEQNLLTIELQQRIQKS